MSKCIEELKKRTLLLVQTNPESDFVFQKWKKNGYCAEIIFKEQVKIMRAIRKVWLNYKLPRIGIWYGDWKKDLHLYDTIILHIGDYSLDLPRWIHKKYPDIRIICWYWNIVDEITNPNSVTDRNVEHWSFDFGDCEKYGMRKNVQYYCPPQKIEKYEVEKDIYFVGRDKGRREQIMRFKTEAERQGLKCEFHVITKTMPLISYEEVQDAIMRSRAILEINKENQTGYTLRTMESLFMNKKLITNNNTILEAPFYNKDNVFVLGKDDIRELEKFMAKPYNASVNKYKKHYELDKWFLNFFE